MIHKHADLSQRAILNTVAELVVPVAIILTVLYGILTAVHPLVLEGPHRWTMAVLAAISTLVAAAVWLVWGRFRGMQNAHNVMAVLAGLATINTISHFVLYPEPQNTTNFIAMAMAVSLVVLSRIWFYGLIGLAFVVWLGIVYTSGIADLGNWGWFYFFSLFVSSAVNEQRIRTARAAGQREGLLTERSRILQELLRAEDLVEPNVDGTYQRLCTSANQEFGTDETSIWLLNTGASVLECAAAAPPVSPGSRMQADTARSDALLSTAAHQGTVAIRDGRDQDGFRHSEFEDEESPFYGASVLASAIMIGGKPVGVILSRTVLKRRNWSIEDRSFASSIAGIAALAFQTREKQLAEALALEAKRLEGLGILAGGVAHDFNNLLTVILGHGELLGLSHSREEFDNSVSAIMKAGTRAKDLAHQMLAYAGRASFVRKAVDLSDLVADMGDEWAQYLLEDTSIRNEIDTSTPRPVDVDPTQIRQVVMNLFTNARDAGASTVTIRIGSDAVTESQPGNVLSQPLEPGPYHWIEVIDDGEGMDEATVQRVFDPFFTTRDRGSGLGLAAAQGILRGHGGTVLVSSQLGVGTKFKLMLPASAKTPELPIQTSQAVASGGAGSRVLLVDDESLLRNLADTMLARTDREVIALENVAAFRQASATLDVHGFEFALVDLSLGDGKGTDVVSQLRKANPGLPVIIMSGYDAFDALKGFELRDSIAFLQKPFSQLQLLQAIAQAKERISTT